LWAKGLDDDDEAAKVIDAKVSPASGGDHERICWRKAGPGKR
jgi:hypothetical protein